MKKFVLVAVLGLTTSVFANDLADKALTYVPNGKVQSTEKDEVKVKTANGTIVEIEFTSSGEFEEASGDVIESDIFVPGDKLKTLAEIATLLKDQGYKLKGDWSYDKGMVDPWHYEVEAIQDGKEVDVKIDAKTGGVFKVEIDD